jgi:NADH-quinone oxidoreductase subunit B
VPTRGTVGFHLRPHYAAGVAGKGRIYAVAGQEPGSPGIQIHVRDLGLACCAVEFAAAIGRGMLVPAEPDPDALSVLIVSGTVTDALAPQVLAVWEELPEPKAAMSFGACSNSGGPYWDSYAVTKGVDRVIPVTTYVPGCPPRPEALIDALRSLEVGQ